MLPHNTEGVSSGTHGESGSKIKTIGLCFYGACTGSPREFMKTCLK
jgi:hypothetical protein